MADRILRVIFAGDAKGAIAASQQLQSSLQQTGQKMQRIGTSLSNAGRTMTRNVTLPIVAAGAASVKMAVDFETAFTRIDAVSNTSQKQLSQWRGEVLKLAGKTARAPQELADALYFLASAGLKANEIIPTLEMSAKAAASGLGNTADIARLTANVLNAYSESGMTAADATDTLVAAVKAGTADPDEFADAMGRILPVASKAKVSFDEIAASLASLSNIGLNVNEGVTAMRGLLQAIQAPGTQAAETLKDIGISTDELRSVLADDGVLGALKLLEERTGGNIDTMRKIVPNVRALTGQLGLTGEKADAVAQIFDDVANSSGSLDKAFETTRKGPAFKFEQLMTRLRTLAIKLGNTLLPIFEKIAKTVGKLVKQFSNLPDAVQENIVKWGILAATLGPVLRLLGGIVRVGGKLPALLFGKAVVGGAARGVGAKVAGGAATAAGATKVGGLVGAGKALAGSAAAGGAAAYLPGLGLVVGIGIAESRERAQDRAAREVLSSGKVGTSTKKGQAAAQELGFGAADLANIDAQIAEMQGRADTIDRERALNNLYATRREIKQGILDLERETTRTGVSNVSKQLDALKVVNGQLSEEQERRISNLVLQEKYGKATAILKGLVDKATESYSKHLGKIEKVQDGFQGWTDSAFAATKATQKAERNLRSLRNAGIETMNALIEAYGNATDAANALAEANAATNWGWESNKPQSRKRGRGSGRNNVLMPDSYPPPRP